MGRLPVSEAVMPVRGSISHSHMGVVDPAGRRLPQAMLPHFNLSDPERRELFLPIGLHIMAASKETPAATVPRLLFGLPLERGQRLIASGMLGNETATLQRGVRVRLVLGYVPASRPWPLFRAYPWVMDVQFPLGRRPGGSKAFDLAPGRTERHWESSPAVPGTRSEEHTSELQSRLHLVCRLLLEKKKKQKSDLMDAARLQERG